MVTVKLYVDNARAAQAILNKGGFVLTIDWPPYAAPTTIRTDESHLSTVTPCGTSSSQTKACFDDRSWQRSTYDGQAIFRIE